MTEFRPIICIDFDGVLHSYTSPWASADVAADPPVEGAIAWLEDLCRGRAVRPMIYSSRSLHAAGVACMREWLQRWGLSPDALSQIEFPTQKPPAFLTIDDRAICFEGVFPDVAAMLAFKPWNKRVSG